MLRTIRRIRRGPRLTVFPPPPSLSSRHYSNLTSPWLRNQPQSDVGQGHSTNTPNAFGSLKRYTKWCFVAFSAFGFTFLSAIAATDLLIEMVEFVPESDKNCIEWEWDVESER